MRILTLISILALSATAAIAQPANPKGSTPAVSGKGTNPDAPVAGSNSFTEGQAKSRIEAGGYASVSDLKKDDQGVWRGSAMKDGKRVNVSLDFQGNVVAR
jgi:opacity protein-like surface antigen